MLPHRSVSSSEPLLVSSVVVLQGAPNSVDHTRQQEQILAPGTDTTASSIIPITPSPVEPEVAAVNTAHSSASAAEYRRKLFIVGDGACGKSTLFIVFLTGKFPQEWAPSVFETYAADVEVDGKHAELALWDHTGLEDYDRLRALSYPDTHVILVCFSISSTDSLDNVTEKWIHEVRHFCSNQPIILVGLKKDLRQDRSTIDWLARQSQRPISSEEGENVARQIGASKYLECSALTGEGVREVFEWATRLALEYELPRKKKRSRFRSLFGFAKQD
ncbi:P-loop containing nucleoside triphosphate hydrolase protein [Cladorrhinum sp. PSN332]|nr:P-loop containing nucleoside triphosphate hydrolase protein [Cladorrhinum sp. PSN332]